MGIISNKKYTLIGYDSVFLNENFTFEDIFYNNKGNPFEWVICVYENFDAISDLKKSGTLYIQINRDNPNSKGIIVRTE
jgi:hypothetical protein